MLTVAAYFMGRDAKFSGECTAEIKANAEITVEKINRLLGAASWKDPVVSSGWRPAALNAGIKGAATHSKHLTAQACDIKDVDRKLARWCFTHQAELERCGLWMEDPRWTPTWTHLQTVPPGSGRRVFIPSSAPPLAQPFPEQR